MGIIDCEWKREGNKNICIHCNYTTSINNLHRNCPNRSIPFEEYSDKIYVAEEEPQLPSLSRRVYNFAKSVTKHVVRGSPVCTEEEIEERLAICKKCPAKLYQSAGPNSGFCTHKSCGCNLKNQVKFLNKLAWADQECPLKFWKAIHKNGV